MQALAVQPRPLSGAVRRTSTSASTTATLRAVQPLALRRVQASALDDRDGKEPGPSPSGNWQQQQQGPSSSGSSSSSWLDIRERYIRPYHLPVAMIGGTLTFGLSNSLSNFKFGEEPFAFVACMLVSGALVTALAWVLFDFIDDDPPRRI